MPSATHTLMLTAEIPESLSFSTGNFCHFRLAFPSFPACFLGRSGSTFRHSRLDRESNFEEMPGQAGHDGELGVTGMSVSGMT